MKVYLACRSIEYEGTQIFSVARTKEKAKELCIERAEKYNEELGEWEVSEAFGYAESKVLNISYSIVYYIAEREVIE